MCIIIIINVEKLFKYIILGMKYYFKGYYTVIDYRGTLRMNIITVVRLMQRLL